MVTVMGFKKRDKNKTRLGLIPPRALFEIGEVLTFGSGKYGANNWTAGCNWERMYSALQRHLLAWVDGNDIDEETKLNHLAHAGCCLLFLLEMALRGIGEDDRIGKEFK